METKYIQISYGEAFASKKQLLSSELNLLHALEEVRNYKVLRKKELMIKNNLKIVLKDLRIKINQIQSTFPEETILKISKEKTKKMKKEQEQNIQGQLQEIQDKLERLQDIKS